MAVGLGVLLSLVMCAANTYVGLYAGMTVSASIPAAVISLGILRGVLRRGTILENNIVQTATSAGESIAAGIIFTVPALLITGIWTDFHYWQTTLVALLGGLLGVLFMIPLRRALIVEDKELVYPEGVACAEVLKAGEERGTGIVLVLMGLVLGTVFKLLISGFSFIKDTLEGAVRLGKTAVYFGSNMSLMLVGVGYIVGPNIATLIFIGGAIGWVLGIPIYGLVYGLPDGTLTNAFHDIWSTQIRYMGVGAMVVGGVWSIIKVRGSIVRGFRGAVLGYRAGEAEGVERTDRDVPSRLIGLGLIVVAIPIFILYRQMTGGTGTGLVAGVAMIIAAFFFVAVSSYIVGLVGSSNNPVSGMVIITVLFASVLLLAFGMTGARGALATLLVAGVVSCAACTAGDVSQDLKTGHLLGATPWKQQLAQMIGVAGAAFIIVPVLTVLHKAYGIGTGEPGALAAPQASLFASITSAMFDDGTLPWNMVAIGAGVGIALIGIDEVLRRRGSAFRTHVMPVAVGIYLPFTLAVPILIGGAVRVLVGRAARRRAKDRSQGRADDTIRRGVLFSSGLIAGESIMGILLAVIIVAGATVPVTIIESNVVSLLAFAGAIAAVVYVTMRGDRKGVSG
ncbi:MAG: oligopeptide transporter, OPT family [Candidatus Brocadiia bacterium]|nr:oligopeptide transporter, OPT family [Candidatus Brocadiia bacterium]